MFEYCEKIDGNCPFAYKKHCGIGKWTSERKDIVSCNGKKPKYSKSFQDMIKRERKKRKWELSDQLSTHHKGSLLATEGSDDLFTLDL